MKKFKYYLIFLIFLSSCQSVKDGLSGRKAENSDEFLVKKKSPLVMPPKFMELPIPGEENLDEEVSDLEKSKKTNSSNPGSAEDFVLKKIKEK